ncbi:hypothetical protein G3M81_12285 [Bacillus paralicheniformis]|uniref:hypothetical protein n=1 Tax=Bacillus paralicheniformis TaxID=1648923 RepID=UPI0013EF106B|nr:hypothetical protein [Bacillus paralicheniformis]MEC0752113.1 hypothetical protein [Bacillus haynesii]QII49470.1 hypothetical protein G3M81_12285 [Bacillus paralicheniformis]
MEQNLKKLYLENTEKPADIYFLDEMDIGWFFELSRFAEENPRKNGEFARSGAGRPSKRGYIDQIPGF